MQEQNGKYKSKNKIIRPLGWTNFLIKNINFIVVGNNPKNNNFGLTNAYFYSLKYFIKIIYKNRHNKHHNYKL